MSLRNAGALAAAVVMGVVGGTSPSPSSCQWSVDASADVFPGTYTFAPSLREQQKANEFWKNPGYDEHLCTQSDGGLLLT